MATKKNESISSEESFLLSVYYSLWRNRCISVVIGLKIPDIICSAETPLSIEDIAVKSGCDSSKQLYPMMKLLTLWGIGIELENKHFTKNRALDLLRRDKGPSLGHIFEYANGDECFTGLRSLASCVKHGKSSFVTEHGMTHTQYMYDLEHCPYKAEKMYEGASNYKIGSDERRRELAENYSAGLKYVTSLLRDIPDVINLHRAFAWSECKKIIDIGGSTGDFLASILKLPGCENIQGYLMDLPDVINEAKTNFHELAVAEHRIKLIKQDIFQPFSNELKLEADTVMMKNFMNQFTSDQEKMAHIFINCRSLFPEEGGKLLIIDYSTPNFIDDDNKSVVGLNEIDVCSRCIHFLNISGNPILFKDEWVKLLNDAGNKLGYQVHKVHDTFPGGLTIFELHYKPIWL